MTSVPFYRDFAAGASTYRPRGEPRRAQRSLWRRVLDAIERSHQRAVERDIVRVFGLGNPDSRFTDEIERRLFDHRSGFQP